MRIQESGEMYLEAIYMLSKKGSAPRSVDVGEYMGYSKPSVSRAMGLLKTAGYIEIDKEGLITLTKSGEDLAYKIYERHTILAEFLKNLGVSDEVASEDACKIEHVLSDESFSAIKEHINKISTEE
jgi:Mn-dependent DtxR family transcriptional regulator